MISILVKTPIVLSPFGSNLFAINKASLVVISAFAATAHNIMVEGSSQYLLAIDVVISSIFFGWSPTAILVIPGRSTSVKSGQFGPWI